MELPPHRKKESILVVDDDHGVTEMMFTQGERRVGYPSGERRVAMRETSRGKTYSIDV